MIIVLKSGFYLDLENTYDIPTFLRNLIFVTDFVSLGCKFVFQYKTCKIYKNNHITGSGILLNGLYKSNLYLRLSLIFSLCMTKIMALSVILLMRISLNFGAWDSHISS